MKTFGSQKAHERILEKTRYRIRIEIGFILALALLIMLFKMELKPSNEHIEITSNEQEVVKMQDIEITKQISRPPPPPRPIVPVVVSNNATILDEIIDIDSEINFDDLTEMALPEAPPEVEESPEEQIFLVVEKMPEIKGGLSALMKLIVYPELARKAGLEGRVYVQFIIDERGRVNNPVIIRGIGGGCDEAALEAVKKVTFTPGLQRGKPVKVKYSLPINFRLQKVKDMQS